MSLRSVSISLTEVCSTGSQLTAPEATVDQAPVVPIDEYLEDRLDVPCIQGESGAAPIKEQPKARNWRRISSPLSFLHSHVLSTKASRPISWGFFLRFQVGDNALGGDACMVLAGGG